MSSSSSVYAPYVLPARQSLGNHLNSHTTGNRLLECCSRSTFSLYNDLETREPEGQQFVGAKQKL